MIEQKDTNSKTQQAKRLVDGYAEKERMEYSSHYENAHAHLLDELRWLNRLLTAHVLRLRRVNFYDGLKDFRHFFIADEEIDAMLAAGILENNDKDNEQQMTELTVKLLAQAQDIRDVIAQRVRKSEKENIFLPLSHLRKCFQLSPIELQTLVICAAPQVDARYEKLYAYLQNDISKKYPSVDLMLGLFCHTAEQRLQMMATFHPNAPLQRFSFIESLGNDGAVSAAQHFFRADPNIVYYLLGNNAINTRIADETRLLPPIDWSKVAINEDLKNRLHQLFKMTMDSPINQTPIFYFHGMQGVGRKTIARALCSEKDMQVAIFDIRSLIRDQNNFAEKVRLILREGLLQPCAVCFDHFEQLEAAADENPTLLKIFIAALQELSWIVFLNSEKPLPAKLLDLDRICPIEIPRPDHGTQQRIWDIHFDGTLEIDEKVDIDQLVSRFDLTGDQIYKAIELTKKSLLLRGEQQERPIVDDLMRSSRTISQPYLMGFTQKIKPVYTWKDIVLPEDTIAQLKEICQRVRQRHKVMDEWGFGRKLSLGKGINALFSGPTGTGKTMAAEIIANELGLDLYRIDLSGVVSKYIGETEKNLDRIFNAAEHSNAILLFDEADALFGKRSEVRDSHDRYANIEISYLLQKMEQYEGLTILATNLKKNLDEAFTRRLAFSVHFPFPDETSRLMIWKGIWPAEIPLTEDLDFKFLSSKFKLSGGNIKNIALAAAFLATEKGNKIVMEHILKATQREYQKLGKTFSEMELGKNMFQ